jgi:predicted metal-binding membrane protein
MVAQWIRTMSAPRWLTLFAMILGAWVLLYLMAFPADLRAAGEIYGSAFWADLCTLTPDAAGLARMILMWALMSAAMMAPTVLPALATYDDIGHATDATGMPRLVAGYLAVWLGFSVAAAGAQMLLFRFGVLDPLGQSVTAAVSAALLALAGLYQFSPVKDACLSKCRRPLTFFMSHWDEGPWRNGLRLGAVCLGCCWALMLLGFVGGVMNLAFMGLATLIMVLEKLPEIGRFVTRPLGVILCLAALATASGII